MKCGKYKLESPKLVGNKIRISFPKFSWYLEPLIAFSWLETYLIIPGQLSQIGSLTSHFVGKFGQVQGLLPLLSPAPWASVSWQPAALQWRWGD